MRGRAIALVLWAVTLGAGAADAADTMFATLDVKRLNWKSDEIIYEGRIEVRGARIVTVRPLVGPGEMACDATGCDHWFHSPPFIRGIMPDKSSQSSQLEDWLELVRIEPANATRPTRKALSESWRASHPCAIDCIHVPTSDSVWPSQKRRKFRWVARTRNGFSDRPAAADGIGRESCRSG